MVPYDSHVRDVDLTPCSQACNVLLMRDATRYMVRAYSAEHEALDTSPGYTGEPTYMTGAAGMLALLASTQTGILRDLDTETEEVVDIAYFRVMARGADGSYYHGETHVTGVGRTARLTAESTQRRGDNGTVFGL
jgi:hypothetical protein